MTALPANNNSNTHKYTSGPNNLSKCSISLYKYHKTHSHGGKMQQKNIIYNFPKRKRDGVKYTSSKIANERLKWNLLFLMVTR
ncbi:UNVERIFIED_CONTAM: hypothetical protein NCL1_35316 [Trichonephila clavipes]